MRWGKLLGSLFVVILVGACARQPTPLEEYLQGRVEGPVAYIPDIQVLTIAERVPVNNDGTFQALTPTDGINTLMVVSPESQRPLMLGIFFPEKYYRPGIARFVGVAPVVDAESTALALVLMNPFFVGVSDKSRAEMAEVIVSLPEFQDLVNAIEKAADEDPYRVLDASRHPEIYRMAVDILPRALEARFGTSEIRYRRSGVTIDDSRPWVECPDGTSINFINPTMVYYWADIVQYDFVNAGASCADPAEHYILPKTRFYDLTCVFEDISCVLDLFQVPPEDTPMDNFPPGEAHLVSMYKGFGDYTIGPATCGAKKYAMLANLWQAIKYILTLATSAGNLLPEGHLVVTGLNAIMDESKQAEFKEALHSLDMWTAIDYIMGIVGLFKDQIVSYLADQFGADAADTLLSAASTVLADVFKFASMAYELSSRTGPFFYDLLTVPEYSAYFVDPDGGCLVDGTPIIVKTLPSIISPGGKLVLLGFFFGNDKTAGTVYVGGTEAPVVFDWRETNITVQVPLNVVNNAVYVVVNGKKSNVIRMRIKTSGAAQDEGGGCVMAGEGASVHPLYGLIFLLPGLTILALRRRFR